MLASYLVSLLAMTAGSLATCSPTPTSHINKATDTPGPASPASPPTKYLFTVNIASPKVYVLGETPAGGRIFEPITGGNFSGPAAHGKVVGGVDYGLTDAQKHFDPDVVYLLETADATPCDILVREKGHAPNVMMLFETACEQYDYLNGVVGYGFAKQIPGGVSVQVFSVGTYAP